MPRSLSIPNIRKRISPVLRKYGVRHARVFGSVSRGENTPKSDVDILIQVGRPMGMITYIQMKREMEQRLGKKVDVVTEKSVNKFLRPYIIKELRAVYDEKR